LNGISIDLNDVKDILFVDDRRDTIGYEEIKNYSNVAAYRDAIVAAKQSYVTDINKAIRRQMARLNSEFSEL